MNRQMLGLLGTFLFFVLLCAPAWATDMVWAPRTPAGGGYIDPDYCIRMAEVVECGFVQVQEHVNFDSNYVGYGSAECDETGRLIFYDAKGERVNLDDFGGYIDDPGNKPNGVIYSSPSKTVITIK